jgi:hypothetical protein
MGAQRVRRVRPDGVPIPFHEEQDALLALLVQPGQPGPRRGPDLDKAVFVAELEPVSFDFGHGLRDAEGEGMSGSYCRFCGNRCFTAHNPADGSVVSR